MSANAPKEDLNTDSPQVAQVLIADLEEWKAAFTREQPDNAGLKAGAATIFEDIISLASAVTLRSQAQQIYDETRGLLEDAVRTHCMESREAAVTEGV